MPQTPRPGHAPVVFTDDAFDQDVARAGNSGRAAAEAARQTYERDGVPVYQLRHVQDEGPDGTILPNCLKVYLPPPDGRFGMVFKLVIDKTGAWLRYLAFGVRHHPEDSHAPTVYEHAHRRLHDNRRTTPETPNAAPEGPAG
jgi:hypothetical protein